MCVELLEATLPHLLAPGNGVGQEVRRTLRFDTLQTLKDRNRGDCLHGECSVENRHHLLLLHLPRQNPNALLHLTDRVTGENGFAVVLKDGEKQEEHDIGVTVHHRLLQRHDA